MIKKDTRANLCSDLNDNACLHGTINCNQNYDPNDSEVKKLMDDRKLTINTVSKSVDSVRGYSISLRKSIVIEGGQAEKGQISVCANEIK